MSSVTSVIKEFELREKKFTYIYNKIIYYFIIYIRELKKPLSKILNDTRDT